MPAIVLAVGQGFGGVVVAVERFDHVLGWPLLAPGGEAADVHEQQGPLAARKRQRIRIADDTLEQIPPDQEIASEILVGWAGVNDGDGEAIPFSEKAKAELLDVPTVTAAIVTAYFSSLQGAKRKN